MGRDRLRISRSVVRIPLGGPAVTPNARTVAAATACCRVLRDERHSAHAATRRLLRAQRRCRYRLPGRWSTVPIDIVFVRGITAALSSTWKPLLVRHVEGSPGLVSMLDKRGRSLRRPREVQSIETTMDDVRAVMDAAGSSSAMLWSGASSTGMAVLFAATYPDRCTGLVLFDPRIEGTRAADYPWAPTTEEWRHQLALIRAGWGDRDISRGWRTSGLPRSRQTRHSATGSSGTCAAA